MSVAVIVLAYHEADFTERALACLKASIVKPAQVVIADRAGIGNMSKAFNAAMDDIAAGVEYIWHVTNVTFAPHVLGRLCKTLAEHPAAAAVHPAFTSDHSHMRPGEPMCAGVPFVEWTAPLVRASTWIPLDEQMPYWGMDLDWSARQRQAGNTLLVDRQVSVEHTYLRYADSEASATRARSLARELNDVSTERRLRERWGDDWMAELWPTHPYVAQGRKVIY